MKYLVVKTDRREKITTQFSGIFYSYIFVNIYFPLFQRNVCRFYRNTTRKILPQLSARLKLWMTSLASTRNTYEKSQKIADGRTKLPLAISNSTEVEVRDTFSVSEHNFLMVLSIISFSLFFLAIRNRLTQLYLWMAWPLCKDETLHNVTIEDITHVPDNDHVITLAVLRKTILNFIRKERTWLEYLNTRPSWQIDGGNMWII